MHVLAVQIGLKNYFVQKLLGDDFFLLREFMEELARHEREISDSFGGNLAVYQSCRDEIKQGVESIIPFLEQQSMTDKSSSPLTLALGADHPLAVQPAHSTQMRRAAERRLTLPAVAGIAGRWPRGITRSALAIGLLEVLQAGFDAVGEVPAQRS